MTKVKITYHDNLISKVEIKGHAGFANKGEDLVCAGVSSVVFGAMNAIDLLCKNSCKFDIKEANVAISVIKNQEQLQTILRVLEIQLESISESYKQFLKIKKEEV